MLHARHAVASILRAAASAAIARESRTRLAASAGALVLTASLSCPPQAHAQQAPASTGSDQQEAPQALQEVEVTGSRIKRTNDFSTPTPTTVLDTTTMESAGVVNVGQALQMAPANLSSFTPASTGNSAFFTGAYIPNLRGLNTYFGSRTLTLIDTERAVQTNQGDSFDLNFIPQVLVSRIDTVTGGGSAAYGSGAIAGVINVILDRNLEGGKIAGDIYQTSDSDGRDRHLGAAYGFGLADNRVHVVLGGEYEKQDPVGCETARSWCAENKGLYETGTNAYGQALYSLGTNLRTGVMSTNGVLGGFYLPTGTVGTSTDNQFTQGNSSGTGGETYYGGATPYAGAYSANTVEGGEGTALNQYTQLMAGTTRGVLSALITAKVTDDINLKVDANWGKVETSAGTSNLSEYESISADNAYIAGTSLATAVANGNTYLFKDWTSQVDQNIYTSTTVKRISVGLDGKYGDSSWTWNGYAEYGLTNRLQYEPDEVHATSLAYALDAVEYDGKIVCASSIPGNAGYGTVLAQGCVPINPFGTQALTSAQIAYAFGSLEEELRYEQTVVAFNSTGDIFRGIGAGAWSAAVGAEWRQELGNNLDNDRLGNGCAASIGITSAEECAARATDFSDQYGTSFGGMTTVEEGYLELNLPLLKDLPFARRLDLDIAGRESHYKEDALYGVAFTDYEADPSAFPVAPATSATHNLATFKAALAWEPVEGVRIRASQSRDARAPNFRELYYGQVLKSGADGGYFGYCEAPGSTNYYTNPCNINLYGNTNLSPETSDTTTVGFVLTPVQIPGLQFSTDWIHVHISNAISQASSTFTEQQVIQSLKSGGNGVVSSGSITWNTAKCGTATACMEDWLAGGSDDISSVNATSFNGAYYDERAVDFSLSYLLPSLPDGSSLSARALTTWTGEQVYQNYAGGQVYSLVGQNGGNALLNDFTPAPRWRGNVSITWSKGILSLTPSMSWVGHGTLLNNGVTSDQGSFYEWVYTGKAAAAGYSYVILPFNYVPSYFKFDLNATLDFGNIGVLKDLQVFTQVNNLLNKAPPFAAAPSGGLFGTGGVAGTNATLYDTMGLAYRIGFRATF